MQLLLLYYYYYILYFPARTAFIHYCNVQTGYSSVLIKWRERQPLLFAEYEEITCRAMATFSVSVAHSACVYFIDLTSAR